MRYTHKARIKEVIEEADKIEGWLSSAEAEFLYNAAKNCRGEGVIVEIGAWKGKSTVCLAHGSKDGKNITVFSIDPHTGSSEHKYRGIEVLQTFREFISNLKYAKANDIVTPIVKTSKAAYLEWDGKPIELLWIDGAHEYEHVKLDFDL